MGQDSGPRRRRFELSGYMSIHFELRSTWAILISTCHIEDQIVIRYKRCSLLRSIEFARNGESVSVLPILWSTPLKNPVTIMGSARQFQGGKQAVSLRRSRPAGCIRLAAFDTRNSHSVNRLDSWPLGHCHSYLVLNPDP